MKIINQDLSTDFDRVVVLVFSDAHYGDAMQDKKRVREFINEVKRNKNYYVILNGDLINNATRNSVSDIYLEEMNPNQAIDKLVETLEPIKDKILVATEGNHEERTYRKDGILLTDRATKELGINDIYTSGAYLLYLSFGRNQGRDCRQTVYSIYGKHGSGGGRTVGGKLNKVDRMKGIINADIFIHSHTHLPAAFRKATKVVDYRNRKVSEKEMLFVNSNAFLGYGGYGEKKGYDVPSTVYPKIILDGYERFARALI